MQQKDKEILDEMMDMADKMPIEHLLRMLNEETGKHLARLDMGTEGFKNPEDKEFSLFKISKISEMLSMKQAIDLVGLSTFKEELNKRMFTSSLFDLNKN